MSDTPRIDFAAFNGSWVRTDFARKLEREVNGLREALELIVAHCEGDDWESAGLRFKMTESDLYLAARQALQQPTAGAAPTAPVVRHLALASAGGAPAGSSAGFLNDAARPSPDQHRD